METVQKTPRRYTLLSRFRYAFDNFMSKGSFTLMAWLGILTMFLISILAVVIMFLELTPEGKDDLNFWQAYWLNITHVLDPGNVGQHEKGWEFMTFMLVVTLIGIIIISTLIGLISNGILDKIEELRKGRSFVIEEDHVLILGWSSKIFTIISELVIANENQKDPTVVVLADMDKVKMEDEIRDKVGATKNTRIICRRGNPIDLHDLQIANPESSKSIIILDTEKENSDSQIIKTILAIVSNRKERKEAYHITAEIKSAHNYHVAKMVGRDEVELILSDEFISKIMVQTSRQSGLSVVYTELMDFGGDEIYFVEEPKMIGKTFLETLFSYEDSSIIGIQQRDGKVLVNPDMKTRVARGDKLIGITEDDDTLVLSKRGLNNLRIDRKVILPGEHTSSRTSESILVIGWNERASTVIKELDNYVKEGSRIRVVASMESPKEIVESLVEETKNVSLDFSQTNTTDMEALEKLDCPQYDYIILLCYQTHYPIQEADAQTLITLLHLRDISQRSPRKLKIVSEMLDIRNRKLADVTRADDFIVSDKLLSLLMTQVAENKYLMRVFEDLFDAEGSEIYIKPIKGYVRTGVPMNFYTVLEAAARRGEIAIGYRIMEDSKEAERGYGVVINPVKSHRVSFHEEDRIIVLAED
ncbi:MAG: NAD-binding protein [Cytophagales bacterium]|nr:NAD-binding protein [Cytophagales bacterium]